MGQKQVTIVRKNMQRSILLLSLFMLSSSTQNIYAAESKEESKPSQPSIFPAPTIHSTTSWTSSLFSSVADTLHWAYKSDGSYLLSLDQEKLSNMSPGARVAQTAKALEYNSTRLHPATGVDGAVLTQRLSHLAQVITLAQSEGITLPAELTVPTVQALDDHIAQLTKVKALLAPAKKS